MLRPIFAAALLTVAAAPAIAQIAFVEEALPGIRFRNPVGVEMAPGQPDRLYIVEQGGGTAASRVRTVVPGDAAPTVFVDVSDRAAAGGEAGLLGLAFHPEYETNGRVFLSYTADVPGVPVFVSRLSEVTRSEADPLVADLSTERVVLEVEQPADNHNGGTVRFGPDGFLYWSLGDGGGGGDPFENGQDPTTLLGTIVRIDVDDVPEGEPYAIPDDNPFAATDGPERDEIFAYGLRNPFKFSAQASGVWVGDVGQNRWEEVDLVVAGGNYGWNEVEGPECFRSGCDLAAYEPPVVSYDHGSQGGFSITGGYVVEVTDLALSFHYLYGDFVSGRLWALPLGSVEPILLLEAVPTSNGGQRAPLIASIDPGPQGNDILLTDYGGTIYRLVIAGTAGESGPARGPALALAGPSPFRDATAVRVEGAGAVRVSVVDVRGREVAVLHDGPARDRLVVDGRALAPGAYAIVARSAAGTTVRWVVRAR
ncbi:PQQ-dependent sugar dehydrogenase [Rubrivirga sp. IMCC43871]|uniref:PQQ-dependent sugar dehydrogenase n=1 Tax=Rubrivirga sp. IMCC43871 TaxID=3391575 RepID=UPI00398FCE90